MHADGQLNTTYGRISFSVDADGSIKNSQTADDLLFALAAATSVQLTQLGVSTPGISRQGEATKQTCSLPITFGDISLKFEVDFDLKRHVSKATLNQMVLKSIIPQALKTAGYDLGDTQTVLPVSPSDSETSLSVALGTQAPSNIPAWMVPDTDLAEQRTPSRARVHA